MFRLLLVAALAPGALGHAPALQSDKTAVEVNRGELSIHAHGMKSDEGALMVALSNSEADYSSRKKAFRSAKVEITDGEAQISFAGLPYGEYAMKVFHDKNLNEKLDFGFMHIPKEPYGFSNNVRRRFGPANWDEARFPLHSEQMKIEIEVK